MLEQKSSYRQIFKATSIFGGVQVYQIIISIIRSKFVAVLLGAQGMGISGLLVSATTLISSITNLGISTSAIREISEANQKGDEKSISFTVEVVKKMAIITGLIGAIFTFVLAPVLSELTFGNNAYRYEFMALSITFLLGSLSGAQSVLMQGLRQLSYLAQSNLYAATLGLFISIPIYYTYGQQGIVPAIIMTAMITTAAAYYFGSKIPAYSSVSISFCEAWKGGQGMIRLGVMLSLSTVIAGVANYITRLFIGRQGDFVDVGLYNAGFAIVNTYVGMIFTAMATDYYPRLSAVSQDSDATNRLVNQQTVMALLILGPILILLLLLIKFVIIILYSSDFLSVVNMVQWIVIAIFFKSITWSIGFLLINKARSKVYFWNELIVNIYTLILNFGGYLFWGLEGLGISFLCAYILATIQTVILIQYYHKIYIDVRTYLILFGYLSLALISIFLHRFAFLNYFTSIIVLLVAFSFSLLELNRLMDLKALLSNFRNKI